ncbi:hypothetical protein MBRA1_003666 [Malassezia brasiliensis]|uniref:SHSP domain-containing protein n=1 Tax=Malassezia brasiliensis TaxID=1821822 RepID=A0AAF0E0R8_9BASI|nr:hypothetical protein MBRA1_003666 [Malassezia brasiliensis]
MAPGADELGGHHAMHLHAPRPQSAAPVSELLDARQSALAKLTEPSVSTPPPSGAQPTNLPHEPAANDSWRSLLPDNDPARLNRDDTHTPEQSWRCFLSAQSPTSDADSHEMYLGPSGSSDRLPPHTDDDDDDAERLSFGRRADLFVRRSVVTPIAIANAHQRLPNMHELETASKDAGEQPKVHAFAYKASDDLYVRPMRPRSIIGVAALDQLDSKPATDAPVKPARPAPPMLHLESDAGEEERANWPTSSRHVMSPIASPLSCTSPVPSATPSPASDGALAAPRPALHPPDAQPIAPITTHPQALREMGGPAVLHGPRSASYPQPNTERGRASESLEDETPAGGEPVKTSDPRVSMMSTDSLYTLSLHVPGFSLDGITVATKGFNRRTLHIIATRWGHGDSDHFERRITFAADAIMTAIRARFDGEHLHVEIPRRTARPTRQRDLPTLASLAQGARPPAY